MPNTKFVHLHLHTEFSMLDGLDPPQKFVEAAVELGHPAIAITDHGTVCGWPTFYHAARKAGIEPILGEEFYMVEDVNHRPTKGEKKEPGEKERHHITVLAKGAKGHAVLGELSTESHRHFYQKPIVDRAILESLGDDAKHLVVLSGCATSMLSVAALSGDKERAATEMMWWRETFPNFYLELMHHNTEFDRKLNKRLINLGKKYGAPWVITNDPHYVMHEDEEHHDALLAIQTASDIDNPDRFRFDGSGYHLRSRQEMRKAFRDYGDEVWKPGARATLDVAKMCKTRVKQWEKRTWHIPKFPDVEDANAELKLLAIRGLKEKGKYKDLAYYKQTAHELKVFEEVGIADFLLITRWCIEEAKRLGIPVGPGRGSVCGTLVGYLIGLHKIDPIKYDLRFERFLNPERPRMPDIDTDFGQERRSEMFTAVEEKFGRENVVHVCTYQRMKNKAAFQSIAGVYGIAFPDRIRISKDLAAKGEEEEDYLPKEIRDDHPDLAARLIRLTGIKRAVSTHPAGVIIADPTHHIRKLVPEMWLPSTKRWVGQYDLDAVEEMGLMKQDFLGLRTLDTVLECRALIKERTGEDIDPDDWVPDEEPDDDKVYEMLTKGDTAGVFQMEGVTNTRGIQEVGCTCFEDIVSTTSLYRTGPIDAGYPEQFNHNRKVGKKRIKYAHPLLKPILERTWGVILYQEQVMDIGEILAGFNMVQVDDIKEAIKHKKSALMDEMRPLFIKGCKETHGIPKSVSKPIWKDIEGYAGYSYNRSHAVAYSMLTYQTARLKCLYPHEYHTALLRTMDRTDKVRTERYMQAAVEGGFKLLPACVNRSDVRALPEGEQEIRLGLADLKGIGPKQAVKLVDARDEQGFETLEEVEAAARNVGVVGVLTASGACEVIGIPAIPGKQEELHEWQFVDTMRKWRQKYRNEVDLPEEGGGDCCVVGEIVRTDKKKTKSNKDYVQWTIRWSPTRQYVIRLWSGTEKHWSLAKGSVVMVFGNYEEQWGNIGIGNPRQIKVLKRVSKKAEKKSA